MFAEMAGHIQTARKCVPQSGALWETAQFYGPASAATVRILMEGAVRSYNDYRQIASTLFGWNARCYLPSLFAAGLMHPAVDREYAETLMATFSLHDLRLIEDEN